MRQGRERRRASSTPTRSGCRLCRGSRTSVRSIAAEATKERRSDAPCCCFGARSPRPARPARTLRRAGRPLPRPAARSPAPALEVDDVQSTAPRKGEVGRGGRGRRARRAARGEQGRVVQRRERDERVALVVESIGSELVAARPRRLVPVLHLAASSSRPPRQGAARRRVRHRAHRVRARSRRPRVVRLLEGRVEREWGRRGGRGRVEEEGSEGRAARRGCGCGERGRGCARGHRSLS